MSSLYSKALNYLKESYHELKKVQWLSLQETQKLTLEVILFSILFAIIYGIFDFVIIKTLFLFK